MRKVSALFLMLLATVGAMAQKSATYQNPVIDTSLPDPTIIRADDNLFYLYATENIPNVPIYRSPDLVHWEMTGTAFTDSTRPTFVPNGRIWAPDINKIKGKYVLYYSMSTWGGEWTCGIGVATASRPEGPFTDQGMLFRSNEMDVQNCIDPFYIEDNGKKYLFFGSFHGIYGVELENNGLAVKKDARRIRIAGTAYEGTYIHKKGEYYYLFASIGRCCEGAKSTYTTVVGRSRNLLGPYFNKKGDSMLDNQHEILIQGNEKFVGTGHNSEIVTDKNGNDWLFYHAVKVAEPEGRVLMMDRVDWENGWPVVKSNSPSLESPVPAF
jgi:beta-xylosidase